VTSSYWVNKIIKKKKKEKKTTQYDGQNIRDTRGRRRRKKQEFGWKKKK
jgi:hypothetical protein